MLAQNDQLVSRVWKETSISRRTTDGYVNATAMCQANGREWFTYARSERSKEYVAALADHLKGSPQNCGNGADGSPQNPTKLIQAITTGPNNLRGTWVHPRIAVDLARWVSPAFAVWVDGWLLDELAAGGVSQVRETQPAPAPALNPHETLDLIERSMGLLERLGVMDQRDQLQLGDMVRNVTARGVGGLLLPACPEDEELTLSDAWLEVTGKSLPREDAPKMGKLVAALYRDEFEKTPPTRLQYVDGAPRQVKSYKRGWLIDAVKTIWDRIHT